MTVALNFPTAIAAAFRCARRGLVYWPSVRPAEHAGVGGAIAAGSYATPRLPGEGQLLKAATARAVASRKHSDGQAVAATPIASDEATPLPSTGTVRRGVVAWISATRTGPHQDFY
jgi:uncharacterized membrane protein YfcA